MTDRAPAETGTAFSSKSSTINPVHFIAHGRIISAELLAFGSLRKSGLRDEAMPCFCLSDVLILALYSSPLLVSKSNSGLFLLSSHESRHQRLSLTYAWILLSHVSCWFSNAEGCWAEDLD